MNLKKFVPYGVALLIAGGAYFTGTVTDIGDAMKLAFDKDALTAECAKLIEGE